MNKYIYVVTDSGGREQDQVCRVISEREIFKIIINTIAEHKRNQILNVTNDEFTMLNGVGYYITGKLIQCKPYKTHVIRMSPDLLHISSTEYDNDQHAYDHLTKIAQGDDSSPWYLDGEESFVSHKGGLTTYYKIVRT